MNSVSIYLPFPLFYWDVVAKRKCNLLFLLLDTPPQACNCIKKETLAQEFYCEFCEIFKKTFFIEHFRTTASVSCFIMKN